MARTANSSRQNYFVYSEDFTNAAWTKHGPSSNPSQSSIAGPYGSNVTANLLVEDTGTSFHDAYAAASGLQFREGQYYTLSAYFKDVDRRYAMLLFDLGVGGNQQCIFDLQGGVVTSTTLNTAGVVTGLCGGTIQALQNGWYRCSFRIFMAITVAAVNPQIGLSNGSNSLYLGTSKSMYIWGAQIVNANWPGGYISTSGATVTNSIRNIALSARAVLSQARSTFVPNQNLFLRSEEFDNAYWTKDVTALPTITADQIANPINGTVDADLFTQGVGNANHRIYGASQILRDNMADDYSIYVKDNNSRYFALTCDGSSEFSAIFDLQTGTIATQNFQANFYINVTYSIESIGNGWFRVGARMTPKGNRAVFMAYAVPISSSVLSGAGAGKSVYIWGAQFVRANWPGPYIKTVASQINASGRIRNIVL